MDLNNRLQNRRQETCPAPREEKIQQTIQRVWDVRYIQEQNHFLTYREFLWSQFCMTRKCWWVLQSVLLLLACQIIPHVSCGYRVRSVGGLGCLFVVLIIPELWRNRECDAIQVEAACFYSLRQIYAARITLFGMVDTALLTAFSISLGQMGFTFTEVLSQFLLPATVTACICFCLLCRSKAVSQTASLAACLIWCGIWWLIMINEVCYRRILPSVWAALFGAALMLLVLAIRRTLRTTNQYWEVTFA